jgi:Flp pilus assembly protein TadG
MMLTRASVKRCVCKRRGDGGQSLAEVALLTPLLLLLLVGTIEVGRFAYYSIEVSNAARAAVQYGAQSLANSQDTAGIQIAADKDAPDISGLGVAPTTSCACSNNPASPVLCATAPVVCLPPNHSVVFLEVDTTKAITPLFSYPGLPSAFTANGKAIMRVAQ